MHFLQCDLIYSVQETAIEKCTWSVGGLFRNFLWWSSFYSFHSFLQAQALPRVYLFNSILSAILSSEPYPGKSREFNNQGWKVNRNLNAIFSFCHQKTIKNRQALHEIIRASSLSVIFVELSFKRLYPTMVVKNFKFMENFNSWMMYFQVKILTLDIFTNMLPPPFSLSPLQSQATMTWNIRLFYMICNFFKWDHFTVLYIYSILSYSMVTFLLSSPLQSKSDTNVIPDKKATLMTGWNL